MQHNLIEIKEKLVSGLDADNNVINENVVTQVIGILEKFQVTKSDLEDTRLGKVVNELRKRTRNPSLAKRAKQLLKSWRKLLNLDTSAEATPANSRSPDLSNEAYAAPAKTASPLIPSYLNGSASNSPKPLGVNASIQNSQAPSLVDSDSKNAPYRKVNYIAPASDGQEAARGAPSGDAAVSGGEASRPTTPIIDVTNSGNRKRRKDEKSDASSSASLSDPPRKTCGLKLILRKDATKDAYSTLSVVSNGASAPPNGVRKRRRNSSGSQTSQQVRDSDSDSMSSRGMRTSTGTGSQRPNPRIKTTAQLIAELQAKSATPSATLNTAVVAEIMGNRIQDKSHEEEAEINYAYISTGKRLKRYEKRTDLRRSAFQLPQQGPASKTELVARFLESAASSANSSPPITPLSSLGGPVSVERIEKLDDQDIEVDVESMSVDESTPLDDDKSESVELLSQVQAQEDSPAPINDHSSVQFNSIPTTAATAAAIVAAATLPELPPLNIDELTWEEKETEDGEEEEVELDEMMQVDENNQVNPTCVQRFLSEQWECVNGVSDSAGVFHSWQSPILRLASFRQEKLPILPYVDTDDFSDVLPVYNSSARIQDVRYLSEGVSLMFDEDFLDIL